MKRLIVHVEGQTEETFVNKVLGPHLYNLCYSNVSARLIGNARQREQRGGGRSWPSVRKEIINHLKGDQECLSTTMVDYYGLPAEGDKAWPGRAESNQLPVEEKAQVVEDAVAQEIASGLGIARSERFIPFIVMHEFEGLLFSDAQLFADGIGKPTMAPYFQAIRDDHVNPEQINDSPVTAPSKRVLQIYPGYNKPLHGSLAASTIGLDVIRRECPHFNDWLGRLEKECQQ